MKKLLFLCAICISVGAAAISTLSTLSNTNMPHLKVDFVPESIEDLQDNSDIIVRANVQSTVDIINEDHITFYITKIKVNDCIQGEVSSDYINILQTYSIEDPILSKDNSDVLLFLEKYQGYLSNDDNTYVCKGLGYGQYYIKNKSVTSCLNNENSIRSITDNKKQLLSDADQFVTYLKNRDYQKQSGK